jgi:hypothetical protein
VIKLEEQEFQRANNSLDFMGNFVKYILRSKELDFFCLKLLHIGKGDYIDKEDYIDNEDYIDDQLKLNRIQRK